MTAAHHPPIIGIYPGSFDPPTLGHLDIACRAARFVEKLIVAVYARPSKNLVFSAEERVALWQASLVSLPHAPANIDIQTYDTLTTAFAEEVGATALIRGLRTVNDFETEFQQAHMYRRLSPDLEVLLLVTDLPHLFISASLVKEVARLGADVSSFVTQPVAEALHAKLATQPPVS
jgi:pantetheine-phosphate adenylyltransferase